MADGWKDAMLLVDDVAALAERLVAEEVRLHIDVAWPRDTGWSAANNRINLQGEHDVLVEPPERPAQSGALFAEAEANLARDLAALRQHLTPGPLVIGNGVEYARDVGFSDGNGELIYEEARKTGPSVGIKRVALEFRR